LLCTDKTLRILIKLDIKELYEKLTW